MNCNCLFLIQIRRIAHLELNYHARVTGEYLSADADIELAKTAYGIKDCYEWFKEEKKGAPTNRNWNQLSFVKLLTGHY
jgi:hypothetical protein